MLVKKCLSVALAIILSLNLCLNLFASEFGSLKIGSQAFLVRTSPISNEVNEYAIDIFSRLSVSNLAAMGFTDQEMVNLSLSPGFCMLDNEEGEYIDNIYHYIIKSNDDFVGSLVVTYTEGEYSFQISKSDYASKLNEIRSNISNKARNEFTIMATESRYYCVDDANSYVLDSKISEGELVSELEPELASYDRLSISPVLGEISINIADSISNAPNILQNSAYTEYVINVPYCNNMIINGTGTCWISVTASIIDYRLNGAFSSTASAEYYRNLLLQNQYIIANNYYGTISDICAYINSPTLCSYSVYSGMPMFIITQTLAYNNSPCAIEYLSQSPWGENHTVVLAGFSCLSSSPHDPQYQSCYIMDPNNTQGLIMIGYSSYYYPWWNNGQPLVWNSTAINSADMPY